MLLELAHKQETFNVLQAQETYKEILERSLKNSNENIDTAEQVSFRISTEIFYVFVMYMYTAFNFTSLLCRRLDNSSRFVQRQIRPKLHKTFYNNSKKVKTFTW